MRAMRLLTACGVMALHLGAIATAGAAESSAEHAGANGSDGLILLQGGTFTMGSALTER